MPGSLDTSEDTPRLDQLAGCLLLEYFWMFLFAAGVGWGASLAWRRVSSAIGQSTAEDEFHPHQQLINDTWEKDGSATSPFHTGCDSGGDGSTVPPPEKEHNSNDFTDKQRDVHSVMGVTGECPMSNGATVCPHKAEARQLQQEVTLLRRELSQCRSTITQLTSREKQLRDRLSEQAQKQFMKGSTKFENLSLGENRPSLLVQRFRDLYAEGRLDAYDALDEIPEISEFDELKGKLLFSVVVLAFRSSQHSLQQVKQTVSQTLQLPNMNTTEPDANHPINSRTVRSAIESYLQQDVESYDVSSIVKEVSQQVYATLYDYPRLKQCRRLQQYIKDSVKLTWALSVQTPPLVIQYDSKLFKEESHTRFHSSDPESNLVKSVLWPGLLEGENGPCLAKGVVIT